MYRVTYTNNQGITYSFVFQLYWDATKFEMALEKEGATRIVISEEKE